jgi:hypothetical protein
MLRTSLADLHRPKFSTKISTSLVEIFDGFRDGNLTSEVAERPYQWKSSKTVTAAVPR